VVFVWIAVALFYKGYKLYREGERAGSAVKEDHY